MTDVLNTAICMHERGHVETVRDRFHPANANREWLRSSYTLARPISEHHRVPRNIPGKVSMAFAPQIVIAITMRDRCVIEFATYREIHSVRFG